MSVELAPGAAVAPVPDDFEYTVDKVVAARHEVADYVRELTRRRPIRSVYLVGSGASYFATWNARYLLDTRATEVSTWHLTSGEFTAHPPRRIGRDSLVVAASHSGGTAETVEAARLAADAGAAVAAITRDPASPLATVADAVFTYPTDSAIVESRMLLFQHFAHALAEPDADGWAERSRTLPRALRAAKADVEPEAAELARRFAGEGLIYVVGAGPSFGVANALACCYLQEMQWMHAAALPAADFFHGPFEAVTRATPVVVLLAEDRSRSTTLRALRFLNRHSDNVVALDSARLSLPGVEPADRAEVSTFALASAARRVADHFAAVRGHALSTRRYMHRVDY